MPPTPAQKTSGRRNATPYPTQTSASVSATPDTAQSRPGCAKGSQGYSIPDLLALVEAVQAFLPLGAQEWERVQQRYNSQYAKVEGRDIRELNSLKTKFRALVTHPKKTGDPDCPKHLCDAKATQNAMDARAHVIACNDPEDEEDEDEVEITGQNAEDELPEEDNSNHDDEQLPSPLNFSDDDGNQPASQSHQSAPKDSIEKTVPSTFSAFGGHPRVSQSGSHRPRTSSSPTFVRLLAANKPGVGIEKQLVAYMDLVSRQERHEENGMIQFYVNQLTDANNTIASLRSEVNKLLSGNQSKTNKVQERLMEKRLENQGLKSQI
ncbi:hypothetical protein PCASD_12860 [Puccinia coronata f. sp. avenae]|uniref:DUF6818 domain-containing protein n=1 Tax=Puccinia coronata f. sp. avenae TaxID=200324 RepID=A0A2N5T8U9_9BASI|nr:hypothetical protein PCASD_12860 [Puccinia coronata f. sp. avenae]